MERSTRQRTAIRAVIEEAGRPLSTQEVLDAAQAGSPGIAIATVYRNVKLLIDAGEIAAVTLPGELPRYESAHHQHHHHFQCVECKRVFDVQGCPGNLAEMAPEGFTVERHDLTLYGHCADCAVRGKVRPRARRNVS